MVRYSSVSHWLCFTCRWSEWTSPIPATIGASTRSLRNIEISAKIPLQDLLGQCEGTDWFGLRCAILGQPLARPGVLMVAEAHTLASASTGSCINQNSHRHSSPDACWLEWTHSFRQR